MRLTQPMKRERTCSWCGEPMDAVQNWQAPVEEKLLNCCSDECQTRRHQADDKAFEALKVLCAAALAQGLDGERVERQFHSMNDYSLEEKVNTVTRCLEQITAGGGRSVRNPLTDIDVDGFASTLRYLGMEQHARVTEHQFKLNQVRGALDLIRFSPIDSNATFHAYNFCAHPPRDESDDWMRELLSDL